jgi:hypothetical protein
MQLSTKRHSKNGFNKKQNLKNKMKLFAFFFSYVAIFLANVSSEHNN